MSGTPSLSRAGAAFLLVVALPITDEAGFALAAALTTWNAVRRRRTG